MTRRKLKLELISPVALILPIFYGAFCPAFQGGNNLLKHDFDFICSNHRKFAKKMKKPGADQPTLAYQKAEALGTNLKTQEAKLTMKAVSVADPKTTRSLIEQAAHDLHLEGWSCPALDN